ncbi:hypothetical protein ACFXKJ_41275, partial [Kitasatospora indigofera]|uniref:hypothetical protein n=1 Tax=Kitasatospora indigofera TaxID=67307 RepID=UPI00368D7CDB
RLQAPSGQPANWTLVTPSGMREEEHLTDHEGVLRSVNLPVVVGAMENLLPGLAAATGLNLLADRPSRMTVFVTARPDGSFSRLRLDGLWVPTTPKRVARDVAEIEEFYDPTAPLQIYTRDAIGPTAYPAFLQAVQELADRTGRPVYVPPPGTAVNIDGHSADLVLAGEGEWQTVAPSNLPAGTTPAPAFRTVDGQLRSGAAPLTDVTGQSWSRDDLRLFVSTSGIGSRAGMSQEAMRRLVESSMDDPVRYWMFLDTDAEGRPAVATHTGHLVALSPREFIRAMWPDEAPGNPSTHRAPTRVPAL